MTRPKTDWLLPALAQIETNLDGDLTLKSLATFVGLSPSHMSRGFTARVGESPSDHVERLRVERAAVMLMVRRATILDVALDCGYRSHETFTRAFTRRFGMTPSAWRTSGSVASRAGPGAEEQLLQGHLSNTTMQQVGPLRMVFIRHLGPYEAVPPDLWSRLVDHAANRPIAHLGILVGVAHDAPGVTAPRSCRFDAGLLVGRPVAASGGVGYQELPEMSVAMTTYVGPYRAIPDAYTEIVRRLRAMAPRIEIVGLPTVEFYRTTTIRPNEPMNQTDIAIPVIRRAS